MLKVLNTKRDNCKRLKVLNTEKMLKVLNLRTKNCKRFGIKWLV